MDSSSWKKGSGKVYTDTHTQYTSLKEGGKERMGEKSNVRLVENLGGNREESNWITGRR